MFLADTFSRVIAFAYNPINPVITIMTDLTVEIPGFTIACRTWGHKDNPVLIALHGWLDNANSFKPIAPMLSKNYYVVAIDLPGHGLSSHLPQGCHYHFVDGIFTLFDAIEALGYRQFNLLGHSMGACLSSLMAGVAPERIDQLFLIEGLGPFSAPEQMCSEQLSRYLSHHNSGASQVIRPYDTIEDAAKARAKRGHISVELAKILCERGVSISSGQYIWCHDRRLVTPTPLYLTEGQILSCLANITASTRLIWANEGFEYNQTMMAKRIKTVPNLKQYHLKGGHHIHMEHPHAVAEIILANE